MSKHEINKGILKTPVFHGSSMFFIKREQFKEVKEGFCFYFRSYRPYYSRRERCFAGVSCEDLSLSNAEYAIKSVLHGLDFPERVVYDSIKYELIQRN